MLPLDVSIVSRDLLVERSDIVSVLGIKTNRLKLIVSVSFRVLRTRMGLLSEFFMGWSPLIVLIPASRKSSVTSSAQSFPLGLNYMPTSRNCGGGINLRMSSFS